jgi:hypothetical protein
MTVALPCAQCGRLFAAGHGALCPSCRPEGRHANEVTIPDFDRGQVVPMNEAAREQMRANGETFDEDASERLQRFFGLE